MGSVPVCPMNALPILVLTARKCTEFLAAAPQIAAALRPAYDQAGQRACRGAKDAAARCTPPPIERWQTHLGPNPSIIAAGGSGPDPKIAAPSRGRKSAPPAWAQRRLR